VPWDSGCRSLQHRGAGASDGARLGDIKEISSRATLYYFRIRRSNSHLEQVRKLGIGINEQADLVRLDKDVARPALEH
jgi:hypothetical protein